MERLEAFAQDEPRSVPSPLAVVALVLLAYTGSAMADHTYAYAELEAHVSCGQEACASASGSITLLANCDASCTVFLRQYQFDVPCPPGNTIPLSLVLHNIDNGDCTGSSTEAPFPVDLLAGSFTLSTAQWDDVLGGTCIILADLGEISAGGRAYISANPEKALHPYLPAVSEWGVSAATLVTLGAGAVLFRKSGVGPPYVKEVHGENRLCSCFH